MHFESRSLKMARKLWPRHAKAIAGLSVIQPQCKLISHSKKTQACLFANELFAELATSKMDGLTNERTALKYMDRDLLERRIEKMKTGKRSVENGVIVSRERHSSRVY